jgi:hypothetical protein
MADIENRLYRMLHTQAVAEREKALLTLELLGEHPAGIGDHSTGDFYKNAEEALMMYVDAEDKINALQKLYDGSSPPPSKLSS